MNTNKLNTEYKQIADAFDRVVIKHEEPEPEHCIHCGVELEIGHDIEMCAACEKQVTEVMATW